MIIKYHQFFDFIESHQINVIIIHGLATIPIEEITKIPTNIKVMWSAWGYDLYTTPHFLMPFIKVNLYHRLTKKFIFHRFTDRLHIFNGLLYQILRYRTTKKAISRIDYFSGVLPIEYTLMCKKSFFHAKRVSFSYFSIDSPTEQFNAPLTGTDILVGNSADPSNNHIDILFLLKERGIDNRKVFVPLSYGGTTEYKKKVVDTGRKLFGDNFIPLTDFLPKEKYFEVLSTCSNIIMGHERQQAMGNISQSIWLGKKIFLFSSSIAYKHLVDLGYNVYTIQQDLIPSNINCMLDDASVAQNKEIFRKNGSVAIYLEKMKTLYKVLEND